jgi:hypothetical protein
MSLDTTQKSPNKIPFGGFLISEEKDVLDTKMILVDILTDSISNYMSVRGVKDFTAGKVKITEEKIPRAPGYGIPVKVGIYCECIIRR